MSPNNYASEWNIAEEMVRVNARFPCNERKSYSKSLNEIYKLIILISHAMLDKKLVIYELGAWLLLEVYNFY